MPVFAGTPVDNAPAQPQGAPPERKVFPGALIAPAAPSAPANDTGAPKLVFAGKPVADSGVAALPGKAASYVAGEVGGAVKGSWEQLKTDFLKSLPDPSKGPPEGFWEQQKAQFDRLTATGKSAVDAFNLITSPLSGLFSAFVAKPFGQAVEKGTGLLLPKGFQIPAAEGEKAIGEATLALGPKGGLGAARAGAEAASRAAAEAPKPVTGSATAMEGDVTASGPAASRRRFFLRKSAPPPDLPMAYPPESPQRESVPAPCRPMDRSLARPRSPSRAPSRISSFSWKATRSRIASTS